MTETIFRKHLFDLDLLTLRWEGLMSDIVASHKQGIKKELQKLFHKKTQFVSLSD